MKLKILTPDALVLEEEVASVTLPGTEGEMTILPTHAAFLATLKKGDVRYRVENQKRQGLRIKEGFVEVLRNEVLVMTQGVPVSEEGPEHR